ncbi:hypothetical protein ES703_111393 [subsurface metagenome]
MFSLIITSLTTRSPAMGRSKYQPTLATGSGYAPVLFRSQASVPAPAPVQVTPSVSKVVVVQSGSLAVKILSLLSPRVQKWGSASVEGT